MSIIFNPRNDDPKITLQTDVVLRMRNDMSEEQMMEEATRIGLYTLSNGTAMVDAFSHRTVPKALPNDWGNNRYLRNQRAYTVIVTMDMRVAEEFREVVSSAERIIADSDEIVRDILKDGTDNPLSKNQEHTLLGKVLKVMEDKGHVDRKDDRCATFKNSKAYLAKDLPIGLFVYHVYDYGAGIEEDYWGAKDLPDLIRTLNAAYPEYPAQWCGSLKFRYKVIRRGLKKNANICVIVIPE